MNSLMSELEQQVMAIAMSDGDDISASVDESIQGPAFGWIPIITNGEMSSQSHRNAEFMPLFETAKDKIIRRICNSCPDNEYKDIFYRRLTSTYNRQLLTMLRNGKFDNSEYNGVTNRCFLDFTLHSRYEDAKGGTNQWEHCHPAGAVSTAQTYMCTLAEMRAFACV